MKILIKNRKNDVIVENRENFFMIAASKDKKDKKIQNNVIKKDVTERPDIFIRCFYC